MARIKDRYLHDVSLAPSTVLGLYPVAVPQEIGGTIQSDIFRYDGTFGKRFHLSLENQSLSYTRGNFGADIGGLLFSSANFNRTELRGDASLGHGVGAFLSLVTLSNEVPGRRGLKLPGVPEREASFGVNWVHPSRFRASARARYTGERRSLGNLDNFTLDAVWTIDTAVAWESKNKRVQLSAAVTNLFDEVIQFDSQEDRQGRTVSFSADIRF